MSNPPALTALELPSLTKLASGKIRELFAVSPSTLLFVSTDRVSAFDVVLASGIPHKGAVLTAASAHWFHLLPTLVPGLKTHFLSLDAPDSLTPEEKDLVRGRSMVVRRGKILQVEAIVRGYLAGSAWAEYKAKGTIHGIQMPAGLKQCAKLPTPLYTPSTKAPLGQHDENIHPSQAAALLGNASHAAKVEELSLAIYTAAADYALERGIIIADTKFEFALDEESGEIMLADEVLTPDSSRFWPVDRYEPGRDQESFDKQGIRNWLVAEGLKGKEGVELPESVWRATEDNYMEVFFRLTGEKFEDTTGGAEREREVGAARERVEGD